MAEKLSTPVDLKKNIRLEMLARRKLFLNQHQMPSSIQQIQNQPWFQNAQTIAIYISQESEFPTRWLYDLCLAYKKKIVAPMMHGTQLKFLVVDQWEALLPNEKNIFEPAFGVEVKPESIDVFFVPLLAFDRSGNRLGRGGVNGGYYDRLFANQAIKGKRVGVGFEVQECFSIPIESHDIPMNYILTERRIIRAF
jgi:5-formyltetrahydrofolate cyclo-ligase